MKKILFISLMSLFSSASLAGPIANIDYIHSAIQTKNNVPIAINTSSGALPSAAANMKYLLSLVDKANEVSPYSVSTSYGNSIYATTAATDTDAAIDAIERLHNCEEPGGYKNGTRCEQCPKDHYCPPNQNNSISCTTINPLFETDGPGKSNSTDCKLLSDGFKITLTGMGAGSVFDFQISAKGNYEINWGDGSSNTSITKTDFNLTKYSHTYSVAGTYVVTLSGIANAYDVAGTSNPTITFYSSTNKSKITALDGNITSIFRTLSGNNPRFYQTFMDCSSISVLPSGLFGELTGAPVENMFLKTFAGCSGLKGGIPIGFFGNLFGQPAYSMFFDTFANCSNLNGPLPLNLFGNINGSAAPFMFSGTFYNCSKLSGSIPTGLFGSLSGNTAMYMFGNTFSGCKSLTGSIPAGLFGNLVGPPSLAMFTGTFYECSGLTGSIPSGLFGSLSGAPADYMFSGTFHFCTGLSGSIPSGLFGSLEGAPKMYMFDFTFNGCSGLTGSVPSGLFGKLIGAPAESMFRNTFAGCNRLTGIEDGIWDLTSLTNITANDMFKDTFFGCSGIVSESPSIAFGNPVKLWSHFSNYTGQTAFRNSTNMQDYSLIPMGWK